MILKEEYLRIRSSTAYNSVSGFVPSALRPNPALDFRYVRNVIHNRKQKAYNERHMHTG